MRALMRQVPGTRTVAQERHRHNPNRILAALNEQDAERISSHLERIDLPRRRYLERRDRSIDYIYFPDSGVASVVADAANLRSVEVGMIGREGVTGIAVSLGVSKSPHDTFMQVPGAGRRISVFHFREAMNES